MRRKFSKVSAIALAVVLSTSSLIPAMAKTNYTSDENDVNSEAVKDSLASEDIIDYSKKGSLTIRKYDMTAASEVGGLSEIDTESTDFSSGEQNLEAEEAFKNYEIEGVEFTYVNVGAIETSSKSKEGTGSDVKVVYEIDSELRTILGLNEVEPEDMTAENEANKCTNEGKYHYDANVLQDALKTTNAKGVEAKNQLEDYAVKHGTATPLTDKEGYTKVENLDLGLYLIVETKVPEQVTITVDPWFTSVPTTHTDGTRWFYDLYVYPKNQSGNPTLEKLVRNATGANATDGTTTAQGKDYLTSEYEKDDKFVNERTEYKYDSSTTASEGDILDYILVSKLPHISSTSTYLTQYKFVDTLSKGVSYQEGTVQVAFYASNPETWASDVTAHKPGEEVDDVKTYDADVNGEDAKYASINDLTNAAAVWNVSSANKNAEIKAKTSKDGTSTLTLTVTEEGLKEINTRYSDYYMVAYYQAKVNSDAEVVLGDEGNPNDVQLTWSRTSTGYYDTLEDEAIVFTYGIDITKTFSDNAGNFGNVEFTMYNTTDGYYVVADESETVGDNKVYYVTGKTDGETKATHFIPNAGGKILVYGIEGDEYTITEVKTDNKYQLLKDPIVVNIKTATQDIQSAIAGWDGMEYNDADAKNDTVSVNSGEGRPTGKVDMVVGEVVSATATVDDVEVDLGKQGESANAVVGLSIKNDKEWFLPKTGGIGFRLLPIIGVLIAGCGLIIVNRKRKDEESGDSELA